MIEQLLRRRSLSRKGKGFQLYAWGQNSNGQLGLGDTSNRDVPTLVPGFDDVIQVSRDSTTVLIRADGTLWGCGHNGSGQLCTGDTTQRTSFVQIGSATNWVKACAGGEGFIVALNDAGELWAAGYNENGSLGVGDNTAKNVLTRVGGLSNWVDISAGTNWDFYIALNDAGEIYSTGRNNGYQLGFNDTTDRNTLTKIGSATNWASITAANQGAYAVNTSGELYVWGINMSGQFGTGSTSSPVITPTKVGVLTDWEKIEAEAYSWAFTIKSGALYACGSNGSGQLGLGDTTDRSTFTQVGSATNWVKADTGQASSLALNSLGELYSTGSEENGQLGLGPSPGSKTSFTLISSGWKDIAIGGGTQGHFALK